VNVKAAKIKVIEKRVYSSVSFLFYAGNSAPWGESAERTNLQRGENWQPWGIFCHGPSLLIKSSMDHHRVYTEWQLPFSGVHSIMIEQSAQPEYIATLPPFVPIDGHKWCDQISSQ